MTVKAGSRLAVFVMALTSRVVHSDPDILGELQFFLELVCQSEPYLIILRLVTHWRYF
jgi:hypothetical protein